MLSPDERRALRAALTSELHWLNDNVQEGHPARRTEFLAEFPNRGEELEEMQRQGFVQEDADGGLFVNERIKNWLAEDDRRR